MTDELLIKKESRSALGKLLARENITVNHGNYRTAYFDVKNRVLGLPDWSDKSKSVYDMLLGHEVGHALYTPEWDEDFRAKYKHFDIINILEDIRIERMIQETYPGLPRYFKEGYTELWNDGFFEVDKEPSDLIFLDRLNLHAKVGSIVDIPLNDEEKDIYDRAYAAKTFDDVLALYDEVLALSQKEKDEKKNLEEDPTGNHQMEKPDEDGEIDPTSGGSNMDDNDDSKDDGTESHSQESDNDDDSGEASSMGVTMEDIEEAIREHLEENSNDEESEDGNSSSDGASMGEQSNDIFKSETQEKFDETLEKNVHDSYDGRKIIFPTRKENFKTCFDDYKTVMNRRKDHIAELEKTREYCDYSKVRVELSDKYSKFKKESKKKVGILVREFEQRKAAYQYSRAQESRTGSIDVTKLHKYKYDDQIFASVTQLADAKSHGMIFLVDYSGSMSPVLSGVLHQLLNLTEFCDKVGVPYTVVSFTSRNTFERSNEKYTRGEIDMDDVQLNEILSSKMKKLDKAFAREFLFHQAEMRCSYSGSAWFVPNEEGLGGTPLDATLANIGHIIKDFRASHKVQKLNVVTLTDGDSHNVDIFEGYEMDGRGGYGLNLDGKIYKVQGSYYRYDKTQGFNKIVAQHYGVNMIGFFLPNARHDAKRQIEKALVSQHKYNEKNEMQYGDRYEMSRKKMAQWKKESHLEMQQTMGYTSYYILDTNLDIRDEDEFQVDIQDKKGLSMADSRASQNKLAREFAKHNTSSKNVRILMRKFAEVIG